MTSHVRLLTVVHVDILLSSGFWREVDDEGFVFTFPAHFHTVIWCCAEVDISKSTEWLPTQVLAFSKLSKEHVCNNASEKARPQVCVSC